MQISTKTNTDHYHVIIVGMGPTGLVLANLLGLAKLRVLILDRFLEPYDLPRAVHLDDEIMRIFQVIGVANEMERIFRPNLGMRFVDEKNNLLLDWPRPQEIGKNGWKPSYKFHQPDLEKILYSRLQKQRSVKIKKGYEVIEALSDTNSVKLKALDIKTNKIFNIESDFVVGCDGARSFVRNHMGIELEDFGFVEDWLVVDVILKKERPDLGLFSIQFCGGDQPATYSPGTGRRLRWEFALKEGTCKEEALDPDYVWGLLGKWVNSDEADIERKAIYTFRSTLANDWVQERFILAGDSAHLTPPFMGQGMCIGLRDTSNLAWKLISIIKGHTTLSFLNSYQIERRPHAKEYILTAIKLGKMLGELRSEASRKKSEPIHMKSLAPKIGKAFKTEEADFARNLSVQPRLSNGRYIDEFVGYNFCLYIDEDLAKELCTDSIDIPIFKSSDDSSIKEYLENQSTKAILVRPDKYVFGSANTIEELDNLLEFKFIRKLTDIIYYGKEI